MSSKICSVCKCCTNNDHSYLSHVICYECYSNQMAHYLFDKYPEDLSEEEEEEKEDFICDNPKI